MRRICATMTLVLKSVCLSVLVASTLSLAFNPTSTRHRNCTYCRSNLVGANFDHFKRIERIKQQIIASIRNEKDKDGKIIDVFNKEPREGLSRDQRTKDILQNDETTENKPISPPKITEEIILSELAGNLSDRDVLQFSINLGNNHGSLEAVSAHLWVLVQRRHRKTRSKGKKIMLEVSSVDSSDQNNVLTALRTRVKKTRWQRISLPRRLVQSFLDSERTLHLRITCDGCGNLVTPVLVAQRDSRKRRRKSKTHSKKNTDKRKKKRFRSKRLRSRSSGPFLVIYTRYKTEQR